MDISRDPHLQKPRCGAPETKTRYGPPAEESYMKECGFCFLPAKMSGEHIYSDWMNRLLPGRWNHTRTFASGLVSNHQTVELNWTANVVCEECNKGWMSKIEDEHAKPILSPLIIGKINIPLSQSAAHSIALFSFKTAAVLDLIPKKEKRKEPFFSRRLRRSFRETLTIPPFVWMWMCPYIPGSYRADVFVNYYDGVLPSAGAIQLYVCTYAIGNFAFQVLAVKSFREQGFRPDPRFDNLAVTFYPRIEPGFVWPRPFALHSVEEFEKFHRRWEGIYPIIR
jgi:hypothetical protein